MPHAVVKVHRAKIAVDVMLRSEAPPAARGVNRNVMPEAVPSLQRAANGQNWRWWQDYGGGRHSRAAVQKDLSWPGDSRV